MIIYDVLGACTSLLSTYYFIRLDTKAWPISLVSTCINSWLYWQKGIYAEMFLESFYFLSICYGWYRWANQKQEKSASLIHLTYWRVFFLCLTILALHLIIFNALKSYTHSTVPELDALTTSLSIVAQCLMCYKVIASWVLWFFADALYAFMYSDKNLPFHMLSMFPYLAMAIYGGVKWCKKYKSEEHVTTNLIPSNHQSDAPMV